LMVGNSPAALPPGLMLDVVPLPLMAGKLPTGSWETVLPDPALALVSEVDELVEVLVVALLTGTSTDTDGSVLKSVALSVAVSFTEVTAVAPAGMATLAIICRGLEPE
jgi:hypothetical protein